MRRSKQPQGKGPPAYAVPDGAHVGGRPFSKLNTRQKRAVIELGIETEEWDTSTWKVIEDNMDNLKPADRIAANVLGFEPKSWFLYCAIVRSKYDMWLKKWQKRDANQSVPGPAGEGSNGKQSRAARAVRKNGAAVPEAAPTPADADPIIEGVAVVDGITAPPPNDAGPSHTMPCQTVPHHAIPCHTIPYPTIS